MHLNKIKILLIGPSGSGKTSIANFISESMNIEEAGPPQPTQGVRIVEFELSNMNVNDKTYNNDIELWDCSGDHRFESCWPALRVGVHGVILVCSPSTANAATREMELLYNYFVSQPKLTTKQCVLFYNCTDEQDDLESLNLYLELNLDHHNRYKMWKEYIPSPDQEYTKKKSSMTVNYLARRWDNRNPHFYFWFKGTSPTFELRNSLCNQAYKLKTVARRN